MDALRTLGLFVATALAEIVGCHLPYLWLEQGKSPCRSLRWQTFVVADPSSDGRWPGLRGLRRGLHRRCHPVVVGRGQSHTAAERLGGRRRLHYFLGMAIIMLGPRDAGSP